MLKKILFTCTLLVFSFALKANAYVTLEFENVPYFNNISFANEFSFIEHEKGDFAFIFNSKKRVIYIKHKDLADTYKLSLSKIHQEAVDTRIKIEDTKLELASYENQLFSLKNNKSQCYQIYANKGLSESLNAGAYNMYALYRAFVYMTGQLMHENKCDKLKLIKSANLTIGMPMAIFAGESQVRVSKVVNSKDQIEGFTSSRNINMKAAKKPGLELQFHLMLSLLDEQNKSLLNDSFYQLPISYRIKAIENLLKSR